MIKTAANIIKGVLRRRKRKIYHFPRIRWSREKLLKHQEDQQLKQLDFGAFTLHYQRPYELLHAYREIFEKEIYRFSTDAASPFIIDCGSNIGLSVVYFKQLYPSARLMAFEPDERNFQLLKKNVQANKLQQVDLQQAAVWTQPGTISFAARESEGSHISLEGGGHSVPSVRLKDLLAGEARVDFLKIDIEGAEYEVMKDIKTELGKVERLFLEYHGKVEETKKLNELLEIVTSAGFRVYLRNAADNLDLPFVQQHTGTLYDVQLNLFCFK